MIAAHIYSSDPKLPVLVCLPGMLGVPDNFLTMMHTWEAHFQSVLIDLHPQNRESGLHDSTRSLASVSYDATSAEIRDFLLKHFPLSQSFYFVGISIGGKIVFDFAAQFPELYAGGIVTDVGLGAFRQSDLFRFVETVIPSLNLQQSWSGIKAELRAKVPVKAVRVLMQTQVEYSEHEQRGEWKRAVQGLKTFLEAQKISDQWNLLPRLSAPTHILRAEHLSGIAPDDYARMKKFPKLFQFETIEGSAHLLHVTHAERIEQAVLRLAPERAHAVENHSMRI